MAEEKNINGLDVSALEESCLQFKKQPELGRSVIRISNKWVSGGHNKAHVKGFYAAGEEHEHSSDFKFEVDEPPVLLGSDKGASPVEYLLTALSGCMTTSIVYHAASRGYQIESLESDYEGDLDIRGFLNVGDNVPKGYQEIRITFRVKTDTSVEELEELYKFSPVYSMLSQAAIVKVKIEKA